ncbi:MAG TPA: hypothetical protein VM889_03935 [Candidatus Thermoplasmatota archaeon]|nr:hypothetical protein [Candidatus Thermoplasmatota archaeon]
MATPLENTPGNPCVGCGPEHPTGLRLAFEREGDIVRTRFEATASREGWPDRLHSGLLYLAMLETANWTLYGLGGRVGIPARTSALDAKRWVATGETLILAGRAVAPREREAAILVEAKDATGASVASLSREYDLPSRAEFLRRMGYERMPAGFEDALPP